MKVSNVVTTQTQHTNRKFLSDIIFTAEKKILFEFPHCDIHQVKSSRRMSCLGFSADGKCVHKALVVVEFSLTTTQCKFIRIINKDFELAHRRAFEVLAGEKSVEKIRGKWKLGQSFREKFFESSMAVVNFSAKI